MTTGLVWDERMMWHDVGALAAHVPPGRFVEPDTPAEGPAAKRRIRNLLEVSGLLNELARIEARQASEAELLAVHAPEYLGRLQRLSDGMGGDAGESAPFTHGSYEIARLAAGSCVVAVRSVLEGEVENAYALVRPPGHHAERDRGRGFCLLANCAIAARDALARGVERIAVVDWDVHHGNGTQAAFWHEPRVLTISLHQDRNFPSDSGHPGERGGDGARASNLNVPLPPGSGPGAYLAAFDRLVAPAVDAFRPELILLASGVDAAALDPYGRMILHSEDFRLLARRLRRLAERHCGGRLIAVHEGGYSTAYAPFCTLAVIEELSGIRTEVEDPFLAELDQMGQRELQPHQDEWLRRVSRELSAGAE